MEAEQLAHASSQAKREADGRRRSGEMEFGELDGEDADAEALGQETSQP